MKCVTIISGGMDSAVLAYHIAETHTQIFLSFDYGQRHKKELEFAAGIAADLKCQHQLIDLTDVTRFLTGSSLTSNIAVPEGHYNEDSMRATVVPNRNAMMLSIAFAVASAQEADNVATGVHTGDRYNYPDCRIEFTTSFQQMQQAALQGFSVPVLWTPFIKISKAEIAALGGNLQVPFERTWSCYKGGKLHCGRCGTCVERLEAMATAGVVDKTVYADSAFWKTAVAEYNKKKA